MVSTWVPKAVFWSQRCLHPLWSCCPKEGGLTERGDERQTKHKADRHKAKRMRGNIPVSDNLENQVPWWMDFDSLISFNYAIPDFFFFRLILERSRCTRTAERINTSKHKFLKQKNQRVWGWGRKSKGKKRETGRPRAKCGQRYPLACFAWL